MVTKSARSSLQCRMLLHRSVDRITYHVIELVTGVSTQLNLYKQIYSDKTNKISREMINLGTVNSLNIR